MLDPREPECTKKEACFVLFLWGTVLFPKTEAPSHLGSILSEKLLSTSKQLLLFSAEGDLKTAQPGLKTQNPGT